MGGNEKREKKRGWGGGDYVYALVYKNLWGHLLGLGTERVLDVKSYVQL